MKKSLLLASLLFLFAFPAAADNQTSVGGRRAAGHIIEDEGTKIKQRVRLNFTGSGVSCSDSGGKTVCDFSGGAGGTSEWTDTGSILHPSEDTVDSVAIGGTTEAGADIFLGVTGDSVFNEQGNSGDFRVEGNTDDTVLLVKGTTSRVGIGNSSPGEKLDVTGNTQTSGQFIEGTGTTTGGAFGLTSLTKTSSFTASNSETIYFCDASSGSITVTLPATADSGNRVYYIVKIDGSANNVTIDGNASETINGSTTKVITVQYTSLTISTDGSNWFVI